MNTGINDTIIILTNKFKVLISTNTFYKEIINLT